MQRPAANRILTAGGKSRPVMDPVAIASALVAARVAQAQLAAAAKMMKNAQAVDAALVQQLVAAAGQNGERLAAAVQQGMGETLDVTA